jgi:hypothetical protein
VSAGKDKYPQRNPDTAFRPVADEGCLVVVPANATVEVLNPVGGKIYAMLDGKHTEDQIVHAVMDEFDVDESRARADFQAFLSELRDKGMLVTRGGDEAGEAARE